MKEPSVTVVSTARNAEMYAAACVTSVARQDSACRHIYIDAGSTDRTYATAEMAMDRAVLREKRDAIPGHRFRCIEAGNKTCTENLYETIHKLPDDEIVIWLDGDDELANASVVSRIKREYSEFDDVWLTYGQFASQSTIKGQQFVTMGWAAPYPPVVVREGNFREHGFVATHLKTFRAGLFKQIKQQDLRHQMSRFQQMAAKAIGEGHPLAASCAGDWMQHAIDLAIMYPMLEMAAERHVFIPDVLCIYNNDNPNSDHNAGRREIQLSEARRIESMQPYSRLTERPW